LALGWGSDSARSAGSARYGGRRQKSQAPSGRAHRGQANGGTLLRGKATRWMVPFRPRSLVVVPLYLLSLFLCVLTRELALACAAPHSFVQNTPFSTTAPTRSRSTRSGSFLLSFFYLPPIPVSLHEAEPLKMRIVRYAERQRCIYDSIRQDGPRAARRNRP